jgi:hypothetical protein
MKLTSRLKCLQIVAVGVALSFGARAYAETAREELVHAYALLSHADHDYGGHRVKAMKEVQAAGKSLGLHLEGNPPSEHEKQLKSDEKVAEAGKLLREARGTLEAKDKEKAATHLDRSIAEVDAALKVK